MASWKVIAALLAGRLAEHLGCPTHENRWREHWEYCPFCADERAYHAYLKAGGTDFRQPAYKGPVITVQELRARKPAPG